MDTPLSLARINVSDDVSLVQSSRLDWFIFGICDVVELVAFIECLLCALCESVTPSDPMRFDFETTNKQKVLLQECMKFNHDSKRLSPLRT